MIMILKRETPYEINYDFEKEKISYKCQSGLRVVFHICALIL